MIFRYPALFLFGFFRNSLKETSLLVHLWERIAYGGVSSSKKSLNWWVMVLNSRIADHGHLMDPLDPTRLTRGVENVIGR